MSEIIQVKAREILDSRGNPSVEVDVMTSDGYTARAEVPSGASTGSHEAVELRDNDKKRYHGKGVLTAVQNVNEILAEKVLGLDVRDQQKIDQVMMDLDGTKNKAKLGANAILGVSMAVAKVAAYEAGLPLYRYLGGVSTYRLPVPLMNILNGGAHANNGLDVQEYMIAPVVGGTFKESLRCGSEIFHTLKKILNEKGLSTAVGDEGGFAPTLKNNEQALELISDAIEKTGYKLGEDVFLALDVAATELYDGKNYRWEGKQISGSDLGQVYASWAKKFPMVSIEDGFSEDDWTSWTSFTKDQGSRIQLVGDDLFVTNPERIQKGIDTNAANALLVKINQIGTISETCKAVDLAHRASFSTVMSHRSGETEDTMIADLAVALGSSQIKTGSLCRGERIAKYNQLLRIEEDLGQNASFWGRAAFRSKM
jgi:enolase